MAVNGNLPTLGLCQKVFSIKVVHDSDDHRLYQSVDGVREIKVGILNGAVFGLRGFGVCDGVEADV